MNDYTPMKRCSKCGIEKPATPEYFTRCKSSKDGLYGNCKECRKEARESYEPHLPKPETKVCNTCDIEKPIHEFHKQRTNPDGYRHECKKCRALKEGHGYVEGVPDGYQRCSVCSEVLPATSEYFHISSQSATGVAYRCKDCQKKYMQEYYRDNPDAIEKKKIANKQWAERNRVRMNFLCNRWLRNNPVYRRLRQSKRRAREMRLPNTFTRSDYDRMMEYWGGCAITGETENLHIDHWIPLVSPDCLGTVAENMIPLTQHLNNSKYNKEPETWAIEKFGEIEGREILRRIEEYFEYIRSVKA